MYRRCYSVINGKYYINVFVRICFLGILRDYFIDFFSSHSSGILNKNIYISNYRQYNIYNGEKEVKCTKKEDKRLWNF